MSTLRDFVSLGFVILMPLISFGQIPTENSFLSSPVSPLFVPDVPVTTALSRLGNAVSGGHVVFGTEILLNAAGQEPHITFQLLPGDTLQTAIETVMRQLPEYQWVVISDHLVNIFPVQRPRNDLLDLKVPQFDLKDQYPGNVLANPTLFISDLLRAMVAENSSPFGGVGYGASYALSEGPHVTLALQDVTIREILNRLTAEMIRSFPSDAPPVGWMVGIKPEPNMPSGRTYSWNSHKSVPSNNWRAAVVAREEKSPPH